MNNYDDIINLTRPKSSRKKQDMLSRASQFSPFAALTGYHSQIEEEARLTDSKVEIDDGIKEILSNKLSYIEENIDSNIDVYVTYFVLDLKKSGGKYITKHGIIKKIDKINHLVIFNDNSKIKMNDIIDVRSDLFNIE